ncbi:MAG: Serine/threonine protein kinase [uncultured Rubrobacteraceae bacterium]|uniref:non-specific serine/threonine protein kinase n=1 Tax=uncultured Rubrobacteraceae bacterium TaxID=349277 RepID=A0A6J4Q5G3_9ACTN|nr:MAG: Serine/threonine protein kinase [uncultured Rubrobacteraceae bacterium]
MAIVYKAEDATLGRVVALKTLHGQFARETTFRSRFKQEARVTASLDHENIVKVYDISQDGDVPFIVAEYVGGGDVGGLLRDAPGGRLGERYTKKLAGQLLQALAYAHRRGVVHRDIKPSNILMTKEGTAKVADFGIARLVEKEESAGEPGEIIGSARYMSPEQLKGEETTPRSDLYSVGILLYHCLTGALPFSGDARSVARQQIHEEPTPPRELNKEISARMEAVILKALAKKAEDRYPSAEAMLEDLRNDSVKGRSAPRRKRSRKSLLKGRKVLVASTVAVLLLLGGGTAMAGLGYVNVGNLPLPWLTEPEASNTAQSAASDSPEAPKAEAALQEARAPAAAMQTAAQETATANDRQTLAYVPNVDSYFDYYAEALLQSLGFKTQVVYEYREGYAAKGVAWGTDPAGGTYAPVDSTVTVYATPVDEPQTPQVVLPPIQ